MCCDNAVACLVMAIPADSPGNGGPSADLTSESGMRCHCTTNCLAPTNDAFKTSSWWSGGSRLRTTVRVSCPGTVNGPLSQKTRPFLATVRHDPVSVSLLALLNSFPAPYFPRACAQGPSSHSHRPFRHHLTRRRTDRKWAS